MLMGSMIVYDALKYSETNFIWLFLSYKNIKFEFSLKELKKRVRRVHINHKNTTKS